MTSSSAPKFGVLMVNLGTPDAPEPTAVRRYLKEFLSDRRVVDLNPILWKPILNLVILNIRPPRVAKAYKSVWMEEGSPLFVLGERLRNNISLSLNVNSQTNIPIVHAMTYGNPSILEGANQLRKAKVNKILVLPMYPQFSATTTAAVYDKLMAGLKKCPSWPDLMLIKDYADHPLYIQGLVESIRKQWDEQGERRHLVLSYHGIPKRYADNGDPYPKRCLLTSRLVAEALGLDESEWSHVYQSRFGREEWLQPYADVTLRSFPANGIKRINIISPAFSVDCLETLEEVTFELGDEFKACGGEAYNYIPALNDSDAQVALYCDLIKQNSKQWEC